MPVNDTTTNRSYQKPNIANTLADDVGRLRSALDSIDTDMASKAPTAGPTFTGVTTVAAGSAGAPSLTFTGSLSTGVYSPGTDQVAISTGGTGRLFVDNLGRVGVNTAGPTYPLDVTGQARVAGDFHISGSSVIDAISQNLFLQSNTGYEIVLRTNGANERARIDSSGRLLVGTSSSAVSWASTGANVQINEAGGIALSTLRASNDANGSIFVMRKTRGSNPGDNTIVANGDTIGNLMWTATDGANPIQAARIVGIVDGTPGLNSMPGGLSFGVTPSGGTGTTERMRLSSSGQTSFYGSSNVHALRSAGASGTSGSLIAGYYGATDVNSGTNCFVVWLNGNVINTNNSYGAISDIKLKENIVDASSQWNDIKALRVRKFNFKQDPSHTQIGLVAQEVEEVSPGLVTEAPDKDADGQELGTVTKSVNYSVLYMKAVKALQEAMSRIEQLETAVAALQGGS